MRALPHLPIDAKSLVDGSATSEQVCVFVKLCQQVLSDGGISVGILVAQVLADRLFGGAGGYTALMKACDSYGLPDILGVTAACEVLVRHYQIPGLPVDVSSGAAKRCVPSLLVSDEGLTPLSTDNARFSKSGVILDGYWLRYDLDMPGQGMSEGFVEALLALALQLSSSDRIGMRIDPDWAVGSEAFLDLRTRAHIHGPKALSEEILSSPQFPERASGTLTVHARSTQGPLDSLFPLDRIEVMWTRKAGQKTVQIEEIRIPSPFRPKNEVTTANRYVHAIWCTVQRKFVHFDGAMRFYEDAVYQARRDGDLRIGRELSSGYTKLFRIDEPITLQQWGDLTARFYYGNELAVEYLEACMMGT